MGLFLVQGIRECQAGARQDAETDQTPAGWILEVHARNEFYRGTGIRCSDLSPVRVTGARSERARAREGAPSKLRPFDSAQGRLWAGIFDGQKNSICRVTHLSTNFFSCPSTPVHPVL